MINDTVIVGAGQAGLGVSYFLQKAGIQHVVFEQGRIGETWLSQRWDSFKLNTLNLMNVLPGLSYDGTEPDGFWTSKELVHYFNRYVELYQLPVQTGITVLSVEMSKDNTLFEVKISKTGQVDEVIFCRAVVIASGVQRKPKIPVFASRIPAGITQIHTSSYRNEATLPPGAVAIIGSAQSGCQITEDLLGAGRTVYLCTSKVGRVPRRYRGRDILEWWIDMKILDVKLDSLKDKSVIRAIQPQVSGLGRHGHTLSLQYLAHQGAIILGGLLDYEEGKLIISDTAAENIRYSDEFSQRVKQDIEAYIGKNGIVAAPIDEDPADIPDLNVSCISPLSRLDLKKSKISTIIWATGFTGDLSWVHLPVSDNVWPPIHKRGVSPVHGLYFIGFPWLHSRKSGIIYGIEEDSQYITDEIKKQLASD